MVSYDPVQAVQHVQLALEARDDRRARSGCGGPAQQRPRRRGGPQFSAARSTPLMRIFRVRGEGSTRPPFKRSPRSFTAPPVPSSSQATAFACPTPRRAWLDWPGSPMFPCPRPRAARGSSPSGILLASVRSGTSGGRAQTRSWVPPTSYSRSVPKLGPHDTINEHPALIDPARQVLIQIDVEPLNTSWTFPIDHVLLADAGYAMDRLADLYGSAGLGTVWQRRGACESRQDGASQSRHQSDR